MQTGLSDMVHHNQKHTEKRMLGNMVQPRYTDVLQNHHSLPIVTLPPIYISVNYTYFKNKYINKVILLPNLIQLPYVQLKIC